MAENHRVVGEERPSRLQGGQPERRLAPAGPTEEEEGPATARHRRGMEEVPVSSRQEVGQGGQDHRPEAGSEALVGTGDHDLPGGGVHPGHNGRGPEHEGPVLQPHVDGGHLHVGRATGTASPRPRKRSVAPDVSPSSPGASRRAPRVAATMTGTGPPQSTTTASHTSPTLSAAVIAWRLYGRRSCRPRSSARPGRHPSPFAPGSVVSRSDDRGSGMDEQMSPRTTTVRPTRPRPSRSGSASIPVPSSASSRADSRGRWSHPFTTGR